MTARLPERIYKHRTQPTGFVRQHGLKLLVHVEEYPTIEEAIAREKALKKWNRAWKLRLIEDGNPNWRDLYEDLIGA